MPYPRKVTDAQLQKIEAIARQRLAIPEDKVLAHEMGIPVKTLQRWLCWMRRKIQCSTWNRETLPSSMKEESR